MIDLQKCNPDLCAFFAMELPWAFGARQLGIGQPLVPWWDKITFPRRMRKRHPRPEVIARRRFSL